MESINGFDHAQLQKRFNTAYGSNDQAVAQFFAPGRVNLVGDHTDYTGGFVFPCGIDSGSLLLIRTNDDNQFRFASTNFEQHAELSKAQISKKQGHDWVNYPLGVIDQFVKRGFVIDGIDCLYSGNVPNGAGLSSSASIEVVTAFAINQLFDCQLSNIELAKLSQSAENEFVGMQCGIMDQFAVAMAQEDHAMFLHCDTLEHRQIPLPLDKHAIVLANTNQRRELNSSAYNTRVAECHRALHLLKTRIPIKMLGELTTNELLANKDLFSKDEVAFKRAAHVSSENERVHAAVKELEQGKLGAFGQLMNASHDSLRDSYEVSSEPLETLVNTARDQAGVIGSRLTGAGFGGCVVNLLENEHCNHFIERVGQLYNEQTKLTADFYIINPGAGVRQVST